jgi:hypothetical protein
MLMRLAAPAQAQPCCGPITPAGERLAHFLDDSDVTQRWQPDGVDELRYYAHGVTWP